MNFTGPLNSYFATSADMTSQYSSHCICTRSQAILKRKEKNAPTHTVKVVGQQRCKLHPQQLPTATSLEFHMHFNGLRLAYAAASCTYKATQGEPETSKVHLNTPFFSSGAFTFCGLPMVAWNELNESSSPQSPQLCYMHP